MKFWLFLIIIADRQVGSGVSRGPGNLLGIVDEYKHKQRRRLLDPIYTLKSVREFEYLMHQPIQTFVEQMRRRANDDINIVEWTNVLATGMWRASNVLKTWLTEINCRCLLICDVRKKLWLVGT